MPPPPQHTPQPRSAAEIRRVFMEFYASKPAPGGAGTSGGHTFVPSSPVVPHDDPTLLFANAGMNQFKPCFLGSVPPGSSLHGLQRAVNSQKCIRAGGKHNDLDDVGKDTYHHTFFEMLGTWSFGDYFKAESIAWAWELLTKVYGIDHARLYVTYFGGDPKAELAPDLEARRIWMEYLPDSRILPGSMKDNFWEMGETGPCGPCSEIHYDRIGGRDASKLVNAGDPNVIEFWNHVFIQFNRSERGLQPLPAKHIDTGMGFERLVSILQAKPSNYDTDVFLPLFAAIERVTGSRVPYRGKVGPADKDQVDMAYRVIADHIRTLTFAITDGAVPSNEGRGYVLRRIIRRAVRYGRQMLGAKTGFFSQLTPVVVEQMGEFFPELRKDPAKVAAVIRDEEESFARTLDRGIVLFDEACVQAFARARLTPHMQMDGATASVQRTHNGGWALQITSPKNAALAGIFTPQSMSAQWADKYFGPSRTLPADDAFKLYDTFGFPVDLTVLMAEERGLKVDTAGFEKLMEEAREKARAGSGGKFAADHGSLALGTEAIAKLKHMGIAPTDDTDKFHGRSIRATVKAIWEGEVGGGGGFAEAVSSSAGLRPVGIILDRTNFYAEMGGQVGDTGRIEVTRESQAGSARNEDAVMGGGGGGGGDFRVEETKSFGGYVVHMGRVHKREIRVGDDVVLSLDESRRAAVASNHTATHLLNLALARTLGPEVNQKGSLVADDRCRFDFSHGKPVAPEELTRIETEVRAAVKADLEVFSLPAPLGAGKAIPGLRAVFGEAYPDPVRVVSIGTPVAEALAGKVNAGGLERSIEFCGGTHVASTGAIGAFALISEEAVAKGVRRLTAISGVPALAAQAAANGLAERLMSADKLEGDALVAEVHAVASQIDTLTIPLVAKQKLRVALASLQDRAKDASKKASAGRAEAVAKVAANMADSSEWDAHPFIVAAIDAGSDKDALTAALNTFRQKRPRSAVLLVSPDSDAGKLTIIAAVPDALIKRGLAAGDWVKVAAAACGGRGGGKPDLAQGGGTDLSKLKDVLSEAQKHAFSKAPN
ncbi:MAG: alanine--tRNA ligase [Phycisphaerales bacterium]